MLTDLVHSGLLYATGSGESTLYGVTSDAERQRLTRQSDQAALANMALGEVYRSPGVFAADLAAALNVPAGDLAPALELPERDGRITRDASGALRASTFQIPIGSGVGWESAVFDHFQAVATGIASKLRLRSRASPAADAVGGTTLRFELSRQHPMVGEVLGLLERIRQQTDELWTPPFEVTAGCIDMATGLPRWCCPETVLPQCVPEP